ncbi:MAG: protein kinase [Vicinamibacteria bacterium]|nr:protein kinase [Vicinamibacteria bacterium]
MIGRRVGPYEILDKLGEGGIGVVYKAQDTRLGRHVALKFLREYYALDREALERFAREARAASQLSHPSLCTVHEIGRDEQGRPFIVMELLLGETLGARLARGPLSPERAVDVAVELCDALDAMHRVGIVHRDLKPGNVFLTDRGRVKVLDFGLAKSFEVGDEEDGVQTGGALIGTLAYMSPEQAFGDEVDARSDLFSAGAVLYEMLTGTPAFSGRTPALTFEAVLRRAPRPLREFDPGLPEELEAVVRRALEKDREKRPSSAAALRTNLLAVRRKLATADQPTATAGRAPRRRAQRRLVAIAGALALIVAVLLGFALSRQPPPAGYDSVAVLPFVVVGGEAGTEYVGDGLAESLGHALSRLPGVRVAPRSAALRQRGRDLDAEGVAAELGVAVVVTGRVTLHQGALLVAVELVDPRQPAPVWAWRYRRPAGRLLEVERELVGDILDRIRPRLTAAERDRLAAGGTGSEEAHRLYLQARYHWERRTEEGLRRSLELFESATLRDPRFALAHAGLADAWVALAGAPPRETRPRAKAAALRALELDPELAEAEAALAMIRFVYDWDAAGAEAGFRRAIARKPDLANAHHWLALFLMSVGRFDEARGELAQARRLDPLSLIIQVNQARVDLYAGRDVEAIAGLRRVLAKDRDFYWAHGYLSLALARTGDLAGAAAAAEKARAGDDGVDAPFWTAIVHARAGRTKQARKDLAEIVQRATGGYLPPFRVAAIHAALGDEAQAGQWLERSFEERSPWLAYARHEPQADPLRRFPALAARLAGVGLAPPLPAPKP